MSRSSRVFKNVIILMCIHMAFWSVFGFYLYTYGPPLDERRYTNPTKSEYMIRDSYSSKINSNSTITNPYIINTDNY